jgi:DNA-binding NarL/FixJ family response regulator
VWKVLIVEDDPQMRAFFAASVRASAQLQLLAAVGTVTEARCWLDDNTQVVDVLLADLGLPDGSGLEVINHARLRHSECEALVISMFGDEDNVLASIEAGALGYIHKDAAPDDIAHTILEMKAGASPISPMIARRVLSKYFALRGKPEPERPTPAKPAVASSTGGDEKSMLSQREQAVLELVARGFSYAEIARLNVVSVHTVQSHIKSIYSKLSVHSKNEAVFEATRMGLLRQPWVDKPQA